MPFPKLQTKRLLLRQVLIADAKEIFALRSNDQVNQFIDRPKAATMADATYFIAFINKGIYENESFYWGIQLKGEEKLIGTICLWNFSPDKKVAEVGFELLPPYQGIGIMNEALQKVIEFAFEVCKVEKLEAYSQVNNQGSTTLLQKNNFSNCPGKKIENNIAYQHFILPVYHNLSLD